MNWDALVAELCTVNDCHAAQLDSMSSDSPQYRSLLKKQNDIIRAAAAVRQAYEKNPNASREKLRKETYKNLVGSVVLLILVQVLLTAFMKYVIEWFLDQIFTSQENSDDTVSLPTK
jgi:hypothetical protein